MAFDFRLPDTGEGLYEAEIVRWRVREGDWVQEDQPLVEVQTDKALVELPSPRSGVVLKLHAREGELVRVGQLLVTIGEPGEAAGDGAPPGARPAADPAVQPTAGPAGQPAAEPTPLPILATPATRHLARQLGVDLSRVRGTGPGGRITEEDVRRAAAAQAAGSAGPPAATGAVHAGTGAAAGVAAPAASTPAPPVPPGTAQPAPVAPRPPAREEPRGAAAPSPLGAVPAAAGAVPAAAEERIPLRGLRRVIADHMVRAAFTAPHATHMDEVDVTELVELRQRAQELARQKGIRLTYLPFIVRAVVAALKEFPTLNAHYDDERQELVIKRYYHIGIAVDTPDGLVVPVLRHAERMGILELAQHIQYLADRARQRRLTPEELKGSTFTLTNVGSLGGVFSTPILNYPEVAILGVHRIRDRAAVVQGAIVPRKFLTLALTFDHRAVDGAVAARFLNRVMQYLENPVWLLLEPI